MENFLFEIVAMIVSGMVAASIILIVCRNDIKWLKEILNDHNERLKILEGKKNVKFSEASN